MPPVFGPVSPSPIRLKSCAGSSGTTVHAVGDAEQRHLRPVEELLDHDPRRSSAACASASSRSVGDDDALAGGQAVVLDDVRRPELVERGAGLRRRRADPGARPSARRPRP